MAYEFTPEFFVLKRFLARTDVHFARKRSIVYKSMTGTLLPRLAAKQARG
jgi:hypothetical protein